jgi:hypothetical protein
VACRRAPPYLPAASSSSRLAHCQPIMPPTLHWCPALCQNYQSQQQTHLSPLLLLQASPASAWIAMTTHTTASRRREWCSHGISLLQASCRVDLSVGGLDAVRVGEPHVAAALLPSPPQQPVPGRQGGQRQHVSQRAAQALPGKGPVCVCRALGESVSKLGGGVLPSLARATAAAAALPIQPPPA